MCVCVCLCVFVCNLLISMYNYYICVFLIVCGCVLTFCDIDHFHSVKWYYMCCVCVHMLWMCSMNIITVAQR